MHFVGIVFVLSLCTSTVTGVTCYFCVNENINECKTTLDCSSHIDACYTIKMPGENKTTKGCQLSSLCADDRITTCCKGNYCNGAKHTAPSFILVVMSSAAWYFF